MDKKSTLPIRKLFYDARAAIRHFLRLSVLRIHMSSPADSVICISRDHEQPCSDIL